MSTGKVRSAMVLAVSAAFLALPSTPAGAVETGSLEVTKVVDWGGVAPDPGAVFEVCVASATLDVGCQEFGSTGGSVTLTDLPVDTYVVSEPGLGSQWGSSIEPNPVVVSAGATASTTVTNTYLVAPPITAEDCKRGGWKQLAEPDGSAFKNQGQCIQLVRTSGS